MRIADHAEELRDNRRGDVELLADPALALAALADALRHGLAALDRAWTAALRAEHVRRAAKHAEALGSAPAGKDGHMHPNRIFAALREVLAARRHHDRRRRRHPELRAHGAASRAPTSTPAPSAASASASPYGDRRGAAAPRSGRWWSITGDGAFGINAMEIDSAKRHGAKAVFIVANNAAWNIERLDQEMNYGGRVVGTTLAWSDYAGDGARLRPARRARHRSGAAAGRDRDAFANAPALIDVVITQDALSAPTPARAWAGCRTTRR